MLTGICQSLDSSSELGLRQRASGSSTLAVFSHSSEFSSDQFPIPAVWPQQTIAHGPNMVFLSGFIFFNLIVTHLLEGKLRHNKNLKSVFEQAMIHGLGISRTYVVWGLL